VEERLARIDLVGLRVAVPRRPRLEHVGDEDVVAREPDLLQELVEELSGAADEREALLVLVHPGRLTDEHEVGVGIARAEDDLGPRLRQRAARADRGLLEQLNELRAALLRAA
jgi:hypothetical protein